MIRPERIGPGPEAVARHYQDLDRYYRELWGEHVHHGLWETGSEAPETAVEALVHRVALEGEVGAGSRVCDVGCGYAGTARLLARHYGARVTGVTLSEAQGRFGKAAAESEGLGDRIGIHVGDWLGDAFETVRSAGPFDVVVAVESMTHMTDLDEALVRVRSVLRPGGRFVACVWLAGDSVGGLGERHLLEPICREGRLAGLPTASEFLQAMGGAGLEGAHHLADLSRQVRQTWDWTIRAAVRRLVEDPEARRFLLDPDQPERVFAITLARIWLAYRTGALRYALFRGDAPA
jgi:tocopherol O-methyltransferase